ncbi:beta strand repeat-containing protein [Methanobacterium sp.]|uniref:beta strand repeat-containing protein n=1 Tax=Methanobacterium sp. TaxID=2164 RepID=UPI003C73A4EF
MFGIVLIGLFVIFSYGVGNVAAAPGDTIYVNGSSGNDSYNGLNSTWTTGLNGPKATIKNATGTITSNGTIYIASGTYNESNIQINTNMNIIGENQENTIINGQQSGYSIFTIISGVNVTITNLTLTNVKTSNDGAISNTGTLTVNNCTFNNNNNADYGGAISNTGTLTVNNSTFTNNNGDYGGAIWNSGDSTLTNNTFINNNGDYGGVIYNEHISTVFVINNTFNNNIAQFSGGVIFNYGTSTETNNTFNNNLVELNLDGVGGGAIYNQGTSTENNNTFSNNTSNSIFGGGAIYNQYILTETNDTFNNNTATHDGGGAIYNAGTLTVISSTFNNNTATYDYGGAIINFGNLKVIDSNFINNTADTGGAIADSFTLNVTGSNFINNTADTGGAIYIDNSPSYSVNVNFNRIIGNTPNSNELYSYGNRAVNATLNWWGLNTSPENEISGTGVTYAPWIILTATSNHSAITIGGNSTVTADLLHDNLGDYLDPVNGDVPDGISANFTSDVLGTINPISTTTLNGSSNTTFTGVSTGISEISSTVDDQTVTTNITITKIPTILSVQWINGYNGKTVNLTSTLRDIYGQLLTGQTVIFNINGQEYNATTNNNGIATLQYIPYSAGNYNVTVNYLGDSNYTASQVMGVLMINPSADLYLQIISSNKNPKTGELFTLTYKLVNKGPDSATNVIISIPLPENFELTNISGDGNWTYNPANNTITWTLTNVSVGDPYLYLNGKINNTGIYVFNSSVLSETYNSNTAGVDPITVNVSENNTNTTTPTNTTNKKDTIKSLTTTTIPMQHTGLPIAGLILAIITVLGGSVISRKK